MSDFVKALQLIKIVGIDDHKDLEKCFEVLADIPAELEKFLDTSKGIEHIMLVANRGFNLLHKHRETYKKYAGMDVDKLLTGFHLIEISLEKSLEE